MTEDGAAVYPLFMRSLSYRLVKVFFLGSVSVLTIIQVEEIVFIIEVILLKLLLGEILITSWPCGLLIFALILSGIGRASKFGSRCLFYLFLHLLFYL